MPSALLLATVAWLGVAARAGAESVPLTVSAWSRACFKELPCWDRVAMMSDGSIHLNGRFNLPRAPPHKPFLPFSALESRVERLGDALSASMRQPSAWFGDGADSVKRVIDSGVLDVRGHPDTVAFPFVQKLLLPKGAVVAVFGDLHGSLHSLLRELNALVERGYLTDNFTVPPQWADRFFMLFLGDYVDRGAFGVEVIFTLLELRLKNMNNVFLARGNHEDEEVNKARFGGSFHAELNAKFPGVPEAQLRKVYRLYDMLPLAIFVGHVQASPSDPAPEFIQGCHGGLEVGWSPRPFLHDSPNDGTVQYAAIPELLRQQWLRRLPPQLQAAIPSDVQRHMQDLGAGKYPAQPSGVYPFVGWLWSDFTVDDVTKAMDFSPGRGFVFGRPVASHWLAEQGIVGVVRAHQHNNNPRAGPMMNHLRETSGLVDNWHQSGLVYTFLSGTECPGFAFHDDSFGLLTVGDAPGDWGLHHCTHETQPQAVRFNDRWFGAVKPPLPRTAWEAEVGRDFEPNVDHACPMEFHFQCRQLPAPFREL